jgi:hypothetical protein
MGLSFSSIDSGLRGSHFIFEGQSFRLANISLPCCFATARYI